MTEAAPVLIEKTDDNGAQWPFAYGLGDILGMALRGEITPAEAQTMANARTAQAQQVTHD